MLSSVLNIFRGFTARGQSGKHYSKKKKKAVKRKQICSECQNFSTVLSQREMTTHGDVMFCVDAVAAFNYCTRVNPRIRNQ